MRLTDARPKVESSGQMEEQFFSIKDQGMIFDILRSKMYSNPILAIAREISCNARDAHREVGKLDLPIQIVLPNSLDSNYRIKDWGPGISPDRMSNIFIQYTASTKRDDDVQTGGFGLGAKTPFSYSDSFAIVTVHGGIKYQYNCFIDPTKVGKLALMSEAPTTEPNGTEIVIPVETKDAHFFAEWTEHACRHWTVKPIIKGGIIEWQSPEMVLEGKGWAIARHSNHEAKMVIDGIEYPLSLDALHTYAKTTLIDSCAGMVLMYFGVGELSLSASREQLYLDKKTQEKIATRLIEMQKDIKQLLDTKIDSYDNLWLANVYYREGLKHVFHSVSFLGTLKWRGYELDNGWMTTGCPSFTFSRGKYSRKNNDPNKLSRSRMSSINFTERAQLFINDLPIKEPTPRYIKKAFEDDGQLLYAHVICPKDAAQEVEINNSIHLDQMAPRRLSEIAKATGRAYTPAASRLLVFKLDAYSAHFRQVSYDSIDVDPNNKVLCLLQKDNYPPHTRRAFITDNHRVLDLEALRSIANKHNDISFYGVDKDLPTERIEEEFGDFQKLEDFIEKRVLDDTTINYVEIRYAIDHRGDVDEYGLGILDAITKEVSDPDSLFLQRGVLHRKIKDISQGDTGILSAYESIKGNITDAQLKRFLKDNPHFDVEKINEKYENTYPLIEAINHYRYSDLMGPVAQYINLIDASNKVQKKTK